MMYGNIFSRLRPQGQYSAARPMNTRPSSAAQQEYINRLAAQQAQTQITPRNPAGLSRPSTPGMDIASRLDQLRAALAGRNRGRYSNPIGLENARRRVLQDFARRKPMEQGRPVAAQPFLAGTSAGSGGGLKGSGYFRHMNQGNWSGRGPDAITRYRRGMVRA